MYPYIAISENAWSFYEIWHSFGLWFFRNERWLNLLLLHLQDSLLLSCLHARYRNALLYGGPQLSRQTRKVNHSRQKHFAHVRNYELREGTPWPHLIVWYLILVQVAIFISTNKQTNKQTNRQTNRQAGRQTDRHTDTQTDRQTDRQTQADRQTQTDRQTDK